MKRALNFGITQENARLMEKVSNLDLEYPGEIVKRTKVGAVGATFQFLVVAVIEITFLGGLFLGPAKALSKMLHVSAKTLEKLTIISLWFHTFSFARMISSEHVLKRS